MGCEDEEREEGVLDVTLCMMLLTSRVVVVVVVDVGVTLDDDNEIISTLNNLGVVDGR